MRLVNIKHAYNPIVPVTTKNAQKAISMYPK